MTTLSGYCECGCGERTELATYTDPRRQMIKGQPKRFIRNHHTRGERNHLWRGGRSVRPDGYVSITLPSHPRADASGRVLEHVLIAEAALGKFLPRGAVIHHVDEARGRIEPRALVICPNDAYHLLLHRRSRAMRESGHADWLKCTICRQYDEPGSLHVDKDGRRARHPHCMKQESANRYTRELLRGLRERITSEMSELEWFAEAYDANINKKPARKVAAA